MPACPLDQLLAGKKNNFNTTKILTAVKFDRRSIIMLAFRFHLSRY